MFSKLFSFFEADNQEADADNSFNSQTALNEEYSRFSDLFPWTGYWEKERLFAIEGEKEGSIVAIGYCIELNPQTGASADMSRLLQEIYRDCLLYTSLSVEALKLIEQALHKNKFTRITVSAVSYTHLDVYKRQR